MEFSLLSPFYSSVKLTIPIAFTYTESPPLIEHPHGSPTSFRLTRHGPATDTPACVSEAIDFGLENSLAASLPSFTYLGIRIGYSNCTVGIGSKVADSAAHGVARGSRRDGKHERGKSFWLTSSVLALQVARVDPVDVVRRFLTILLTVFLFTPIGPGVLSPFFGSCWSAMRAGGTFASLSFPSGCEA